MRKVRHYRQSHASAYSSGKCTQEQNKQIPILCIREQHARRNRGHASRATASSADGRRRAGEENAWSAEHWSPLQCSD